MPHFIWISYCNATEKPKNSQILPHFQLQNALEVLSNGTNIKMNNGAQLQTFPYTTIWKLFRSSNSLMLMLNSHISPFKSMKDKKQTRNLFSAVTSESTGWLATLPPLKWHTRVNAWYTLSCQISACSEHPVTHVGQKTAKIQPKMHFFQIFNFGGPCTHPFADHG